MQRKKSNPELKAGIFVLSGLLLTLSAILMLGGFDDIVHSQYELKAKFSDVSGLGRGSVVRSGGIQIGRVTDLDFNESYDSIVVTMLVKEKFQSRIREDSKVKMLTQGVLGDKYIEIIGGSPESAIAKSGYVLDSDGLSGLQKMLKGGESVVELLEKNLQNLRVITESFAKDQKSEIFFNNLTETSESLNSVAAALNKGRGAQELNRTLKNLRILTEKINRGEGTVGALLNDATLYEDLKHLIGGANRNSVLKFFVRQAVKSSDEGQKEKIERDQEAKKVSEKKPNG